MTNAYKAANDPNWSSVRAKRLGKKMGEEEHLKRAKAYNTGTGTSNTQQKSRPSGTYSRTQGQKSGSGFKERMKDHFKKANEQNRTRWGDKFREDMKKEKKSKKPFFTKTRKVALGAGVATGVIGSVVAGASAGAKKEKSPEKRTRQRSIDKGL